MKITTSEQLSAYLKGVRRDSGNSQSQVGDKVGLGQNTISNFEHNPATTKLDTLFKLLSALELELEVHPRNAAGNSKVDKITGWAQEW